MKQLTGNQVRALFLEFFKSKGHKVEPSHSLIPNEDPTLLWVNSGVAALKKYFDGTITPLMFHVLLMHKNQFVQTILKMSELLQDIIHFLKC